MMPKSILEMVTEIVTEFVANQSRWLNEEEVASIIKRTYRELKQIESLEASGATLEEIDKSIGVQPSAPEVEEPRKEPEATEPKVDPRNSILADKILCIECGAGFKTLTHTHLKEHALSTEQYKKKWGIPAKQPLAAKNVTQRRRDQARENNVGEDLRQHRIRVRSREVSTNIHR